LERFSVVCFFANSKDMSPEKQELYRYFVNVANSAYQYFNEFLTWLWSCLSGASGFIFSYFRNNTSLILFGVTIALALLIFGHEIQKAGNSILAWFKKTFKWVMPGCSVIIILIIYLLLISVTDLPYIPLAGTFRYYFSKIYTFTMNYFELNPEKSFVVNDITIDQKSRYIGERGKLILFSVFTVMFLRYLYVEYERKLFDKLPLGKILFKLYKLDMEKTHSLIPA
jgi:hypothetical protein